MTYLMTPSPAVESHDPSIDQKLPFRLTCVGLSNPDIYTVNGQPHDIEGPRTKRSRRARGKSNSHDVRYEPSIIICVASCGNAFRNANNSTSFSCLLRDPVWSLRSWNTPDLPVTLELDLGVVTARVLQIICRTHAGSAIPLIARIGGSLSGSI